MLVVNLLLVCLLLSPASLYAKTYEERMEEVKQQIAGEVQRAHEIKLEQAKIEVLARMEQLGAGDTYVSASAGSNVVSTNRNTSEASSTSRAS